MADLLEMTLEYLGLSKRDSDRYLGVRRIGSLSKGQQRQRLALRHRHPGRIWQWRHYYPYGLFHPSWNISHGDPLLNYWQHTSQIEQLRQQVFMSGEGYDRCLGREGANLRGRYTAIEDGEADIQHNQFECSDVLLYESQRSHGVLRPNHLMVSETSGRQSLERRADIGIIFDNQNEGTIHR